MTALIRSLVPRPRASLTIDQVASIMRSGGYVSPLQQPSLAQPIEEIDHDYLAYLFSIMRANPIAFGAMVLRAQVFSQARFIFRRIQDGEPQAPFGTRALEPLERPEPLKDTATFLKEASFDADLAGNWFGVRRPQRIKRLRPDWCWLILGSRTFDEDFDPRDVDAEVVGLAYQPGGRYSGTPPETFAVGEFAHFAPIPDPYVGYRGMSWLTPLVREVEADQAMSRHKLMFLRNGATPSTVVKIPPAMDKAKAAEFIELFEQEHTGALNAYRTIYLGNGWDVEVVGKDLEQIDFKAVQGASETRIAVAARVPPVLLHISEGLQGSSLNSGNYNANKRDFADTTMRDLWGSMASALETIVTPPSGAELWYNERLIPFLQQDATDSAEILSKQAATMRTLWDGGADPQSVIAAVTAGDLRRVKHSGNLSVQLHPDGQPPASGPVEQEEPAEPSASLETPFAVADVRCTGCDRLLAKRTAPGGAFETKCRDCGALVAA